MNRYQRVLAAGWALAGFLVLVSVAAWSTVGPTLTPGSISVMQKRQSALTSAPIDTSGLAMSAALLRTRNPFRVDRKPTDQRWNPWEPVERRAASPHPSRPVLTLVGIVGGPPWTALVEGIPGRENGVLLTIGIEVGGIRLIEIKGDTARLSGLDTAWVLTPRRPWQ